MVIGIIYSRIIINLEIAAKIDIFQFYRKEFEILSYVFTTINNRFQGMVTLLQPFQETFCIRKIVQKTQLMP